MEKIQIWSGRVFCYMKFKVQIFGKISNFKFFLFKLFTNVFKLLLSNNVWIFKCNHKKLDFSEPIQYFFSKKLNISGWISQKLNTPETSYVACKVVLYSTTHKPKIFGFERHDPFLLDDLAWNDTYIYIYMYTCGADIETRP